MQRNAREQPVQRIRTKRRIARQSGNATVKLASRMRHPGIVGRHLRKVVRGLGTGATTDIEVGFGGYDV